MDTLVYMYIYMYMYLKIPANLSRAILAMLHVEAPVRKNNVIWTEL